jgi:hypothetical protein
VLRDIRFWRIETAQQLRSLNISPPATALNVFIFRMKAQKHALVFGASGISGNALCNELLEYPNKNTFDKVTGLTNRPLSIKDAQLPEDPRLRLISGIDLTRDVDTVKRELETKVDDIHEVTHVFFMGIKQSG